MSMMVVSDDEFLAELRKMEEQNNKKKESHNSVPSNVVQMPEKGRGNNKATPDVVREFVAQELNEGAKAQDVIDCIPVSSSSASAYKVGAHSTSTYHEPEPHLKQVVDNTRKKVSNKAMNVMEMALEGITPDKIAGAKLRDVATVAQAMSAIVRNMEPEVNETNIQNNTVYYVPAMRNEESFEVLRIDE